MCTQHNDMTSSQVQTRIFWKSQVLANSVHERPILKSSIQSLKRNECADHKQVQYVHTIFLAHIHLFHQNFLNYGQIPNLYYGRMSSWLGWHAPHPRKDLMISLKRESPSSAAWRQYRTPFRRHLEIPRMEWMWLRHVMRLRTHSNPTIIWFLLL